MKNILKPAATVVISRDSKDNRLEILLLQRTSQASFLPNFWVFAGGAVDQDDAPDASEIERARSAACREAHEESGLFLEPHSLVSYSHWTAPENFPKRFSTWFFISSISNKAEVKIDNQEIQNYQWLSPIEAIEKHQQGDLQIMAPTFKTLLELVQYKTTKELLAAARVSTPTTYFPKVTQRGDTSIFLYENDSGYETADNSMTAKLDRITYKNNILNYEKS